jgi:uncharacterized protein
MLRSDAPGSGAPLERTRRILMKHVPWKAAILITLGLGSANVCSAQTSPSTSGDFKWSETKRLEIPLRDGARLSASLYQPRGRKESAPCILTMTPYGAQTYRDRGMYFASHGLAFLSVDVRGTGKSSGQFQPFIQEASDAHDVIEWLAKQRYCNGKVGMWGGSYAGYDQWAAVKERPPHLATIVPVAAPYGGVDFPIEGHTFPPYPLQWLTFTDQRRAPRDEKYQDPEFWTIALRRWFESGSSLNTLDSFIGAPSVLFQQWLAHPQVDDHWDGYNPTSQQYADTSIPILSITGSYDGDQAGSLTHYRQHQRYAAPEAQQRHFLIIGPWDHGGTRTPAVEFRGIKVGPASLVDLPRLHVDWYAWTMGMGPRPAFLRKNVAYYVMEADAWRYADSLEAATGSMLSLFLDSQTNPTDFGRAGRLSNQAATGKPDSYIYDPKDVSSAALGAEANSDSLTEQRLVVAAHGKHLVYQTTPLVEDTEITGFFGLSAWLAIDQPDTDFVAAVYEVSADGSSCILLTRDVVKARYREDQRRPKLVATREPLRYDFKGFSFISRQVQKGRYLRLVIGPNNSMYSNKNYNSGADVVSESVKDARTVNVVLHHSAEYPSVLKVPLGQPRS